MKITCAVIGAGNFGKHYIRILSGSSRASLSAIVNTSGKYEQEGLSKLVKVTSDLDSVLDDPAISAVIIATPANTHFAIAKKAIEKNKHMFVEKPTCSSLAEVKELQKLLKRQDTVFMVGHQYLYNDYIRYVRRVIENNTLGKPVFVDAEHFYYKPVSSAVGCFWETATHELAIMDFLFNPQGIKDAVGEAVCTQAKDTDDCASVDLKFKTGFAAHISTSWISPQRVRKMTIYFEKGSIHFDDRHPDKNKLSVSKEAEVIYPEIMAKESLQTEVDAFLDSVEKGTQPPTDIDHAIRVTEMLDKVYSKVIWPKVRK